MPVAQWPNPVQRAFAAANPATYVTMQARSELGISADAKLATWTRSDDISAITVPTLVIRARYDTMGPAHLRQLAERLPAGTCLHCPNGNHLSMYDDQQIYVSGLVDFLQGV